MAHPIEEKAFIFREAHSLDELLLLLSLRYKSFSESRVESVLKKNKYEIDLDIWDLRARHSGLFMLSKKEASPIGYVRLVADSDSPLKKEILSLQSKYPSLFEEVQIPPPEPYPLFTYCPQADVLHAFYQKIKFEGAKLVEASRLSLAPSMRSLRIANRVVESIFAAAVASNIEYAILSCSSRSKTFYSRFGFQPVPGTLEFPVFEVISCCLWVRAKEAPSPNRERILEKAAALKAMGVICYYPAPTEKFLKPDKAHRQQVFESFDPRTRAVHYRGRS